MRTTIKAFRGDSIKRVVFALLESSQWFQVEPWPDDTWMVTVKAENKPFLEVLAERCETQKGD